MRRENVSASLSEVKLPKSNWTVSPVSGSTWLWKPRPARLALRLSAALRGSGSDTTRNPVCVVTFVCENPPATSCRATADARSRSEMGPTRTVYRRLSGGGGDVCGGGAEDPGSFWRAGEVGGTSAPFWADADVG